jgi:hypothetical protein
MRYSNSHYCFVIEKCYYFGWCFAGLNKRGGTSSEYVAL